jgi:sugar diacid utilization regulator
VSASGSVTVGELQPLLQRWQARLLAGERGLGRAVTWASTMRARLPAFETFQGGELALLSLATLHALRSQLVALSLGTVVEQLAETGVSGIAVAGIEGATLTRDDAQALEEAKARADLRDLPFFGLPPGTPLDKLEADVHALVVARRDRQLSSRVVADPLTARFRATLRGEALDALLSGTYAGEPQMRSRAAQLGHDLSQPHVALWVELDAGTLGSTPTLPAEEPAPLADEFAEALRLSLDAWARARATQVVALLPLARSEQGVDGLSERVQGLLAQLAAGPPGGATGGAKGIGGWAAGIGEAAIGPAQVRRSATEAHDAARLGLQLFGPRRVARIGDLGVYQLLLVLRQTGELEAFVRRTLAPLSADVKNREQHYETLEAYFACNGNVTQAAKELSLHRNSLLYRLGNIRDLLGRDLDDPELRLALQLALKGRRVLAMRDL